MDQSWKSSCGIKQDPSSLFCSKVYTKYLTVVWYHTAAKIRPIQHCCLNKTFYIKLTCLLVVFSRGNNFCNHVKRTSELTAAKAAKVLGFTTIFSIKHFIVCHLDGAHEVVLCIEVDTNYKLQTSGGWTTPLMSKFKGIRIRISSRLLSRKCTKHPSCRAHITTCIKANPSVSNLAIIPNPELTHVCYREKKNRLLSCLLRRGLTVICRKLRTTK